MRPDSLRSLSFVAALLATSGIAPTAAAQSAEGIRPNIFVVEGLAGVWKTSEKEGSASSEGGLSVGSAGPLTTTNHSLRLGYHRVLGSLTLGGALHYGTYAGGFSQVLLAPRVGALFGSGGVSIWPRAGVTYGRSKVDFGVVSSSTSEVMAAGELLLLAELAPQVGLLFGPGVEVGVSGSAKTESPGKSDSTDYKSTVFGAQLGLFADF